MSEKTVLFDSGDAAHEQTVTGWVSRHGHFFGKDERIARYDGCTHTACTGCGKPVSKSWTSCEGCRLESTKERYTALPFKPWDGETPACIFDDDRYFFDFDALADYCDDLSIEAGSVMLVHCRPTAFCALDPDEFFCDDLPDSMEYGSSFLSDDVYRAAEAFNAAVKAMGPVSWYADKLRVDLRHFNAWSNNA